MPLFTNIGGKLIEIKSLNTTTGNILKPIYGTPKENMKFHWGGFTGESIIDKMLIGTVTLNCPTYVSVLIEIPDNTANTLFTAPTDDILTKYFTIDVTRYDYRFKYMEVASISFNNETYSLTNSKTYLRTSSGWSLEEDFVKNTTLTKPLLTNNTTTEKQYEVTVSRYSYYHVLRYDKGSLDYYTDYKKKYYPMDGMTADFTFTFQTLNNG